jgi:hypothetical protein
MGSLTKVWLQKDGVLGIPLRRSLAYIEEGSKSVTHGAQAPFPRFPAVRRRKTNTSDPLPKLQSDLFYASKQAIRNVETTTWCKSSSYPRFVILP